MAHYRCSSPHTISQKTVLAMLQAPSTIGPKEGELVLYTNSNGLTKQYRVASTDGQTVGLDTPNGILYVPRSQVKTAAPNSILDTLQSNEWEVTSFNPKSRVVCIDIVTDIGRRHISVTLPALSYK
jgi:hypothetical protein